MNIFLAESPSRLANLKRKIAAMESDRDHRARLPVFTTGHEPLDACLGGGLAVGRLHEIFAAQPGDAASAASYALMLSQRAAPDAPILWARQEIGVSRSGAVFGAGLIELGLDPSRFILVNVVDMRMLLKAADEILRCRRIGAVIIEAWGETASLTLTASRRLTLAAEKSGVTALLLRIAASPAPSAAQSRWQVAPLPSAPLLANAPGRPALDIRLLRHRSGLPEQSWHVEWDRDRHRFCAPEVPGAMAPLSLRRSGAMGREAFT